MRVSSVQDNYLIIHEVQNDVKKALIPKAHVTPPSFLLSPAALLYPLFDASQGILHPCGVASDTPSYSDTRIEAAAQERPRRGSGHVRGMRRVGAFLPIVPRIGFLSMLLFSHCHVCLNAGQKALMLSKSACLIIGTNLFHQLAPSRVVTTFYYYSISKIMTTFYGCLPYPFSLKISGFCSLLFSAFSVI